VPEHPPPIEDYALIGDCRTAALVGRNGSIDWLCYSPACFAALLGMPGNGRWQIAPAEAGCTATRRYRGDTLVLETLFETPSGTVALIDFMAPDNPAIVRIVEGRTGSVTLALELVLRFDYGAIVPWVTRLNHGSGIRAVAGPDQIVLLSDVPLRGRAMTTVASFTVAAGERVRFAMAHAESHLPPPVPPNAEQALAVAERRWTDWSARCTYQGRWGDQVRRSLLTLKALSYGPTGGIVAAPTTSLPEHLGGTRNWDYRYCWLRDSAFTLRALMGAGHSAEAQAWGAWLRRSVAGSPSQIRILYGLAGERSVVEWEVPWLSGYRDSRPVRIGNAASGQLQLDIFGELMEAFYQEMALGFVRPASSWGAVRVLIEHLETQWRQPDEGIWEVRGGKRHFTFSKAMAWVAFDRAIRLAEAHGLSAPLARWRAARDAIHAMVCEQGFNAARNSFVQSFGGDVLDASLLLLPIFGFLPPDDPRIVGTVAAIGRELMVDGLVLRYRTQEANDGLPAGEGVFLACSFWYVDNLVLQGRHAEAEALFERLLSLCNDVGLLAEEYDPDARRFLGNFPQAFSHLALIHSALNFENRRRGDDVTTGVATESMDAAGRTIA
jgi:GH15 family glucan-1,4-alpha-glucosidase